LIGPVARKLGSDLTRNAETPPNFSFHIWPRQFVTKITRKGAGMRSKVARKCWFLGIGEIDGEMATAAVIQECLSGQCMAHRLTLAVTSRSERMRAGGPVHCGVGQRVA
jgi:hypothetical protein